MKILFFDNWSFGKTYLDPVMTSLSRRHEVSFACNDRRMVKSLTDERATSLRSFANARRESGGDAHYAEQFDLEDYGGSFLCLLKKYRPDVVVSVSSHGIEHRHLNRVCSHLGLPTALVMHGVRGLTRPARTVSKTFSERIDRLSVMVPRAAYYARQATRYLADRVRMHGVTQLIQPAQLRDVGCLFIDHKRFMHRPPSNDQFEYSLVSVTCEADIAYFQSSYGISKGERETRFVKHGSLDLSMLNGVVNQANSARAAQALFVSQPVVSGGLVNNEGYERLLRALAAGCRDSDIELTVRPHPRDDFPLLENISKNLDLKISTLCLKDDVKNASIVLGMNSSLLHAAALVGKPMVAFDFASYPVCPAIQAEAQTLIHVDDLDESDLARAIASAINDVNTTPIDLSVHEDPTEMLCREISSLGDGSGRAV